jgi:hypothetical protein
LRTVPPNMFPAIFFARKHPQHLILNLAPLS